MLAKNKFTVIHYYDEIQGRMQDVGSWVCGGWSSGRKSQNTRNPYEVLGNLFYRCRDPDGLCAPDGILT